MLSDSEQQSYELITIAMDSGKLPQFPVTDTKKVSVEYFTNVWIKDESTQETGTHKDRMAWEIVMAYYAILQAKEKDGTTDPLPHFSIISAGSSAFAVQTQLRKYNLPSLKILVDTTTDQRVLDYLQSIGCEIHTADLGSRVLSSKDILNLTDNNHGFDITSNRALDPGIRFYDWMAYEILNENPDYVFIPYGTGQLYENILNIAKKIITSEKSDSVFAGDKKSISSCNFIGATTNNPKTIATKLYAPFRPFTESSPEWIRLFIQQGYCGKHSVIREVSEEYIRIGNEIFQKLNIPSEYSGSAAMGLLYQMKNAISQNAKILVINTGRSKFPKQ